MLFERWAASLVLHHKPPVHSSTCSQNSSSRPDCGERVKLHLALHHATKLTNCTLPRHRKHLPLKAPLPPARRKVVPATCKHRQVQPAQRLHKEHPAVRKSASYNAAVSLTGQMNVGDGVRAAPTSLQPEERP